MIDEIPIPGLKWIDEDGPLSHGEMALYSLISQLGMLSMMDDNSIKPMVL